MCDMEGKDDDGINVQGANTADVLRSTAGKGSFINAGRHGGGSTRAQAEDRLDARIEDQKKKAEAAAEAAIKPGVVVDILQEGDSVFKVDGQIYDKKIWPLFLKAVEALKKSKG